MPTSGIKAGRQLRAVGRKHLRQPAQDRGPDGPSGKPEHDHQRQGMREESGGIGEPGHGPRQERRRRAPRQQQNAALADGQCDHRTDQSDRRQDEQET